MKEAQCSCNQRSSILKLDYLDPQLQHRNALKMPTNIQFIKLKLKQKWGTKNCNETIKETEKLSGMDQFPKFQQLQVHMQKWWGGGGQNIRKA